MKCLFLLFVLYESDEEGTCHSKAEKITPDAHGFLREKHNVLQISTAFLEKVGRYQHQLSVLSYNCF